MNIQSYTLLLMCAAQCWELNHDLWWSIPEKYVSQDWCCPGYPFYQMGHMYHNAVCRCVQDFTPTALSCYNTCMTDLSSCWDSSAEAQTNCQHEQKESMCPFPLFGFLFTQWFADISLPPDGVDSCWLGKRWHLHMFGESMITFIHLNIYTCASSQSVWLQSDPQILVAD